MLAFRLALALGQPDPDAMLDSMPRRVWLEWRAYWEAEPWDETRADLRAAIIAHTVHSHLRQRGRALRLDDFMAVRPPRKRKSKAEIKALFAWLNQGKPHAQAD